MSMITENTVVYKPTAKERVLSDLNSVNYVSGVNTVFENKDMAITVFDCNGDAPWEIEDSDKLETNYNEDIIALETNYLDGDTLWTRIPHDTENTLIEWLKDRLNKAEYNAVKKSIAYSC